MTELHKIVFIIKHGEDKYLSRNSRKLSSKQCLTLLGTKNQELVFMFQGVLRHITVKMSKFSESNINTD